MIRKHSAIAVMRTGRNLEQSLKQKGATAAKFHP